MLVGGRCANVAQHTSLTSHAFPANPTMYQDDNRLIIKVKNWQLPAPLIGGKEIVAAPNSISLLYSDNRSLKSPFEFADMRLGESIKTNESIAKLLKANGAELNFDLFSNPNLFPKPILFPNGLNISYQSLVDLTGEPMETSKVIFLLNEIFRLKSVEQKRTTTYLVPSLYRFTDDDDSRESVRVPEPVAPPICPPKTKREKLGKKKGTRSLSGERDMYKRSYFHACEVLLTIMVGANQEGGNRSVVSLVRSAPEIPALLTQISACIAGTGLAVVFFAVSWMVNLGDVIPTASELVSMGVGLGFMWVAWSVVKLRDAIASIRKSFSDVASDVGTILKDIYFRCAVLLGLFVLQIGSC